MRSSKRLELGTADRFPLRKRPVTQGLGPFLSLLVLLLQIRDIRRAEQWWWSHVPAAVNGNSMRTRAANIATELSLHSPPCSQIISFGTRTIQQGTRALPV